MPLVELIGKEVASRSVPDPPKDLGHRVIFTEDLFDEAGRLIGQHSGFCTLVRLGPPQMFECLATVLLPGGQVNGRGLLGPGVVGQGRRVAIGGGTDLYANARGQVTVIGQPKVANEPERTLYVLDITL